MKKHALLAVCAFSLAQPALALDRNIISQLEKLDPRERMEQRCDIEAMSRIAAEQKGFRPDKVIAYTFSDPVVTGNAIKAAGAAFRSGGDWYTLKYKCETGPRHLKVRDFHYRVGEKVPREDWQEYYLYD